MTTEIASLQDLTVRNQKLSKAVMLLKKQYEEGLQEKSALEAKLKEQEVTKEAYIQAQRDLIALSDKLVEKEELHLSKTQHFESEIIRLQKELELMQKKVARSEEETVFLKNILEEKENKLLKLRMEEERAKDLLFALENKDRDLLALNQKLDEQKKSYERVQSFIQEKEKALVGLQEENEKLKHSQGQLEIKHQEESRKAIEKARLETAAIKERENQLFHTLKEVEEKRQILLQEVGLNASKLMDLQKEKDLLIEQVDFQLKTMNALEEKNQELQSQLLKKQQEEESFFSEREQLHESLKKQEKEVEALLHERLLFSEKEERWFGKEKELESRVKELIETLASLQENYEESERKANLISAIEEEKKAVEKKISFYEEELEELEKERNSLKEERDLLLPLQEKVQKYEREANEKADLIEQHLISLENLSAMKKKLQKEVADLQEKHQMAQQYLAKKVKENTTLRDLCEKNKVQNLELQGQLTALQAKLNQVEGAFELQKAVTLEKTQAAESRAHMAEASAKDWQEKFLASQEKLQIAGARLTELEKLKIEYDQMVHVFANIRSIMGRPAIESSIEPLKPREEKPHAFETATIPMSPFPELTPIKPATADLFSLFKAEPEETRDMKINPQTLFDV